MREKLVRAVMPELRTLTEHLVKTAVERTTLASLDGRRELEASIERAVAPLIDRALAPLVEKQRELEAALGELRRTEFRPQASPSVAAQHAPNPLPSPASAIVASPQVATRAAPGAPALNVALNPSARRPRPDLILAAHDASASWELPSELNGSRRKRAVVWILALGVVLLLLTVAGLAVLSNTGRYL